MYEQLNLREWPFHVTPDREFAAVWAGRKTTKQQIERLLRGMALVRASSLHLFWANFGMGKTHTLFHIEHLCKTKFRDLVPVYTMLPKQPKGFTDLYRAIAAALPYDLLRERLVDVGRDMHDVSSHVLFTDFPDVANALLSTFSQDARKANLARQWLTAQRIRQRDLAILDVTRNIRSPEDAVAALTILTRLLTSGAGRHAKALVMVDEFQRVGELPARARQQVNVGLHTYFNANPHGLGLLLTFSFGRQDNLTFMLTPELISRASPQTVALDRLTSAEAIEFVADLFSQFRCTPASNPLSPFSAPAAEEIVRFISDHKALTPRRLMLYFDHVLREYVLDHGPDGEIAAEDAGVYLSSPELGALDTDAPES